jgi:hypothetical protein
MRESPMAEKHWLTLLHCVMATVVTLPGIGLARHLAMEQPLSALLLALLAVILPVLIATRVAWASGFAAGRRAMEKTRTP